MVRVPYQEKGAVNYLANRLTSLLYTLDPGDCRPVVVVCIGTNRSTGDSLGPFTGLYLLEYSELPVYGQIFEPVHAQNLAERLDFIYCNYLDPLIIAVDAMVTDDQARVGQISLRYGPLCPGIATRKELGQVGDISLTGVVNVAGVTPEMTSLVLASTPLDRVLGMSWVIGETIIAACSRRAAGYAAARYIAV